MFEFNDTGIGTRFRFTLIHDFGGAVNAVAFEDRCGEAHLGHAEISDRGAIGGIGDRNANHQAKRENRINERLSPFGFGGAEMRVDMERLRIERHVREQHVVHLCDGAREPMGEYMTDAEILEIEAAAR